jgi:predicted RNA-binding protein (virulence factor B family)
MSDLSKARERRRSLPFNEIVDRCRVGLVAIAGAGFETFQFPHRARTQVRTSEVVPKTAALHYRPKTMAALGKRNTLRVLRDAPPGMYLDGEQLGEILLPRKYITDKMRPGGSIDVFVYLDSEDRLVATTETPFVYVGEFACLECVGFNPKIGCFLGWGLEKDLLLPLREQENPVYPGDKVVVFVYLDERSGRIVASARLRRHLDLTPPNYHNDQPVHLIIAGETPLGYKAIIDHAHSGLLYRAEVSAPLETGQEVTGYVRTVRPDGKIDLRLDREGYRRVAPLADRILAHLRANNGRMDLNDESSPDEIRAAFDTSKKAFKQALGALYRERKIRIVEDRVELMKK